MQNPGNTILPERLKAGGPIRLDDPEYPVIGEIFAATLMACAVMNATGDVAWVRKYSNGITGTSIAESTTIFPPFYTNFGRFKQLGKRLFIHHHCPFLDIGALLLEEEVLIGPKLSLITENRPTGGHCLPDRYTSKKAPGRVRCRASQLAKMRWWLPVRSCRKMCRTMLL